MKVIVSIPDHLYSRMTAVIPTRQLGEVIARLLKGEIEKRERELCNAATAVEQDDELRSEMHDWEITVGDGIHQARKGKRQVG